MLNEAYLKKTTNARHMLPCETVVCPVQAIEIDSIALTHRVTSV